MSNSEYEDEAIKATALATFSGSIPTLTEKRIDFIRQLAMLEIDLDPAVFKFPICQPKGAPGSNLSVSHLEVISRLNGPEGRKSIPEIADSLKLTLRLATPFEGLAACGEILKISNVALYGGDFTGSFGIQTGISRPSRFMVLENFFGKPRISYDFPECSDTFLGLLATKKDSA